MEKIRFAPEKKILVVFTYAPAGLGHLRVVNSLSEALADKDSAVLLGAYDRGIESIHKFISINLVARSIMEWVQRGEPQKIFTRLYRNYLKAGSKNLYEKIYDVFEQRVDVPKNIIFVCAHFGIAHQLAAIKTTIEKEIGVNVYLVVQVTDDSPQYIWYVPKADLTFVPSEKTKEDLIAYGRKEKLLPTKFEVVPYPVSPFLCEKLSANQFRNRVKQVERFSQETIQMAVPISGAAVSMEFYRHLIDKLNSKSSNFTFHVVSRLVTFTKLFINKAKNLPNVKVYTSSFDREVVDLYDELYKKEIISLEITKPSEQAFKALLTTEQVGGSILLFSKPVGRQEYDNLAFMRRHNLIFTEEEQKYLWDKAEKSESISDLSIVELFENKGKIRGMELPFGSENAANFIWWCIKHGLFEKMMEQGQYEDKNPETKSNGVEIFWEKVKDLLEKD